MSAKKAGVAATPKVVRVAMGVNVVLVLVAILLPRIPNLKDRGAAGPAIAFVIPMALILVIGMAAATRAYLLARRQELRMKWTALIPLLMFLVGIFATLALVYFEVSSPGAVN